MLTPEIASQNLTNWAEALIVENNWYPHEYFTQYRHTGWSLQSIFWYHISGETCDDAWENFAGLANWSEFLCDDNLEMAALFLLFIAEFIRTEGLTPETFK